MVSVRRARATGRITFGCTRRTGPARACPVCPRSGGIVTPRGAGEPNRYASESTDKLDAKNTKWDSDFVTQATQKLLDEFEALPDQDRSELVAELARRVALAPHDLPQDDDLVAAADRLFTELDRREQPE